MKRVTKPKKHVIRLYLSGISQMVKLEWLSIENDSIIKD